MIHPRQRTHQGHRGLAPAVLLSVLLVLLAGAPPAAAWLHDSDGNRIDDRIQAVESLGLAAGFEGGDVEDGRARIAIFGGDTEPLRYGVYVGYDHHPTAEDLDALADSGVSTAVLHPYRFIDYVRMELTFAEIETVAALPGVTRVEAIPMMYPVNNVATRTSGVSADDFQRFPTVHEHLGITGCGVVVSVLDTGVNDAPDPVTGFPGHESVQGKFVAGGDFFLGDPNFNTGTDDSSNPVDRGEAASTHGTHVAGTAIGTGGSSGVFGSVAPCADLVDQKVLSDAGAGFGSADGVEWAILNKDRYGIRVLNLSLGSLDESDGTDASSQTINAAFDAGLVPVIAMGNDGETGFVSSPAAADKALSIGALADQNSVRRDDDRIAGFSNEGPRDSDGDADFTDEMKPLVAGPGAGIVSADGSLLSDGRQYKSLSGTSMSTPHVAGVVALVLAANPALGPAEVVEILRQTSEHRNDWGKTPPGADPFPEGDPNYHPSGGWGQVDAYAAVKEALRLAGDPASRTQVVFADARPAEDASAGGFHERVGSPGGGSAPSVTLVFEGEQVTYSYATSVAGGEAEVFLDGASAGTVSFAGTAHRRSPEFGHSATFGGLGEGTHELVIEHRGGVSYVDGFRVVSCPGGGGDASAVTTRSETTASREDLVAGTLVRTLEVGPEAESISVVVDGSDRPLAVSLLDAAGTLVASGEALLDGLTVSGVDAPANGSGSYSLQVTDALGGSASVELSVAVTVRVR